MALAGLTLALEDGLLFYALGSKREF